MNMEQKENDKKISLKRKTHHQTLEWMIGIPKTVENGMKQVFLELLNIDGNLKHKYQKGEILVRYEGKKPPREMELIVLHNLEKSLNDLHLIQMRRKGLGMVPGSFL